MKRKADYTRDGSENESTNSSFSSLEVPRRRRGRPRKQGNSRSGSYRFRKRVKVNYNEDTDEDEKPTDHAQEVSHIGNSAAEISTDSSLSEVDLGSFSPNSVGSAVVYDISELATGQTGLKENSLGKEYLRNSKSIYTAPVDRQTVNQFDNFHSGYPPHSGKSEQVPSKFTVHSEPVHHQPILPQYWNSQPFVHSDRIYTTSSCLLLPAPNYYIGHNNISYPALGLSTTPYSLLPPGPNYYTGNSNNPYYSCSSSGGLSQLPLPQPLATSSRDNELAPVARVFGEVGKTNRRETLDSTTSIGSNLVRNERKTSQTKEARIPSKIASSKPETMAPSYRNQSTRRQNRIVDHDVFEGLPVRHWRREPVTVAPPPKPDSNSSKNDIWAIELPYGMPKDSHLLPQHSQDLLRAARSGKLYKRPLPIEDDEADPEIGEKPEKKDEDSKDKGFQAKAWKQVPRHLEGPDIEYLAKRRKGVVAAGSKPVVIPTVTKATVKRVDAAGNEYTQDVVVPHGQEIEGELISKTIIPDPAAVGPDGLLLQPTPIKRKSAQRKKMKGPGRGRKKKVAAPTSVPTTGDLSVVGTEATEAGSTGPDSVVVKIEASETAQPTQNEDTEMADGLMASDGENDDSDVGDYGEDGEEDEGSDHPSPSKPPRQESPSPISVPMTTDQLPDLIPDPIRDPIPHDTEMNEVSTSPVVARNEGSLESLSKDVALATSPLTSPIEVTPRLDLAEKLAPIEEVMQQQVSEVAPSPLPLPPPSPTMVEVEAAVEELKAEEEEERKLIEIVEQVTSRDEPSEVGAAPPEILPIEAPEIDKESSSPPAIAPEPVQAEVTAEDPDMDDDFPDLLGDLEKSLERPAAPVVVEAKIASPAKSAEPESSTLNESKDL